MQNFFKGLKVIELASVLAGPAVGMFFAELGAQVVKVENARTGGDTTRHWKLPEEDPSAAASAYFFSANWGKEHVFLDLREQAHLEKLLGWIAGADVVISNFKPGSAEKMGLDSVSLRKKNPRLIYAQISAYGKDDPRPGFDVAMQAETGWLSMNGELGGQPCKLPVALIDLLVAHQLKGGILVALLHRERAGQGSEVHASLFDASISALANQASNYLNLGKVPQRLGNLHPNLAPYGEIFKTKEGQELLLATGTEQHFRDLCNCLEMSGLGEDARFATNAKRLAHRRELRALLGPAFARQGADVLLKKFSAAKLPVTPIRDLKEVFELPAAQKLVLEEGLPDGGKSRRVRTAVFSIQSTVLPRGEYAPDP